MYILFILNNLRVFLTVNIIRSKVDLDAEGLVGVFDGGQGEI